MLRQWRPDRILDGYTNGRNTVPLPAERPAFQLIADPHGCFAPVVQLQRFSVLSALGQLTRDRKRAANRYLWSRSGEYGFQSVQAIPCLGRAQSAGVPDSGVQRAKPLQPEQPE